MAVETDKILIFTPGWIREVNPAVDEIELTTNFWSRNFRRGTGNPDGVVTGQLGDLFQRSDAAEFYVNTDGSTAWSQVILSGELPLSEVLLVGNTTGPTPIILSSGSSVRGFDGAIGNPGGPAVLIGGLGDGAGAGGSASVLGGNSSGSGLGGAANLIGGSSVSSTGGSLQIRAGDSTSGSGGSAMVRGGNSVTGLGGSFTLFAGTGGGSSNGGILTLRGGDASGTGAGGQVFIRSGLPSSGASGTVDIRTAGAPTNTVGNITLLPGETNSGTAGSVLITGGESQTVLAGGVSLTGGVSSSGNGGQVSLTGGNSTSGNGGNVVILGGSGTVNGVTIIQGIKYYGALASNPTAPAPANGDRYFNTTIGVEMFYDGARSKWLSVEQHLLEFGRTGNVTAGTYLRGPGTVILSPTLGFRSFRDATFTALTITRANATTPASVQIMASGTPIYTFAIGGLNAFTDNTIDVDFNALNIIGVRNNTAGTTTIQSPILWLLYRWRT